MKQDFKFSVVIPVYNVENYLEETIQSVINQTIGFEENIQMILVNDGSPDNSGAICEKYQKLYPDNVIYVEQKNSGVSAARNNGIKHMRGKYVNFLDSDDVWPKEIFKLVWDMFEKNPGLPLVAVRQKHFEASDSYTALNYKFKQGTRIVDVEEEYEMIQLSVTSAFMATQYIGDIRYDERVKYSEDAKFIYEVLMNSGKKEYGLIANPCHMYRKRFSQNSAIQTKDINPDWYLITPTVCYDYLLNLSHEKFPEYINTIAFYIAYDYQWRVRANLDKFISKEIKEEYLKITKELFARIPDEVILKLQNTNQIQKAIMLNYKYNNEYNKVLDILIANKNIAMRLDILEANENKLKIEGYSDVLKSYDVDYYVKINGKFKKLKLMDRAYPNNVSFMAEDTSLVGFKLELDIDKTDKIEFYISKGDKKYVMPILLKGLTKLSTVKGAYYYYNKNIVTATENAIKISHNKSRFIKEIKFLLKIRSKKALILRLIHDLSFKGKKKIWIFSDRQQVAGDNAEVLFKYVNEQKNKNLKTYFVIDKKSKDIDRLKKIGKVVYYDSLKYKMLFLKADKIISSHSERYTTNCFGKSIKWFKDLFKFNYIFLQHGIIKNDLSHWLQKYNKNISMFVTSTKGEYNSILDYNYYYDKSVVKLTGLPRYDNLYKKDIDEKKQILVLPTWRSYIAGSRILGSQKRMYNEKFKESYFYKTYNDFLNNEELLKVLKDKGYKMKFCLHPSLAVQAKDFKSNDYVEVCKSNINYQYEFKSSKLLITDYSSVACDFAYLRKPVIYIRGDKEEFFANHICSEGYFDEEKEGFGKITYTAEELSKEVIEAINKEFKLEKRYEQNINKFFKFHDGDNCKRVYSEILKIKNN